MIADLNIPISADTYPYSLLQSIAVVQSALLSPLPLLGEDLLREHSRTSHKQSLEGDNSAASYLCPKVLVTIAAAYAQFNNKAAMLSCFIQRHIT